jgi:hypothetical protein
MLGNTVGRGRNRDDTVLGMDPRPRYLSENFDAKLLCYRGVRCVEAHRTGPGNGQRSG